MFYRLFDHHTHACDHNKNDQNEHNADQALPRKAAMYLRMSDPRQECSTEIQEKIIRTYAEKNNIEIICTYSDEGKSGVVATGRHSFQKLMADVENKEAALSFSLLLVYDVSRWGRFQRTDESAHYEHMCRLAGMDVHYVAEQFKNDGSPIPELIKTVKRTMAAEYSRELSIKVFNGQYHHVERGFRQGGLAGFGLRRMLVDENRNQKGQLEIGEHKSIQTDRVILVPGPEDEVETVNWIYEMFVSEGWSETQITEDLNRRGVKTDFGRPWRRPEKLRCYVGRALPCGASKDCS